MKIACIQMDVQLGCPEENIRRVAQLVEEAMLEKPDVLVLPETWDTGFFPKERLCDLCDRDGRRTKAVIGALAAKHQVNIVAGSVSNEKDGSMYNTAMVFDREGRCIASYDKTHLFSPMGEDSYYARGNALCCFELDGVSCGLIICYDIRFPELTRSLTLQGIGMLFAVSQWPAERISHLQSLSVARAIENQIFLVCCNACGTSETAVFGGRSLMVDPWGCILAQAKEKEQILYADADLSQLQMIRNSIHVFRDRRPELYQL